MNYKKNLVTCRLCLSPTCKVNYYWLKMLINIKKNVNKTVGIKWVVQ
jgi:hypothetical protein